jgi:hypothetical protein
VDVNRSISRRRYRCSNLEPSTLPVRRVAGCFIRSADVHKWRDRIEFGAVLRRQMLPMPNLTLGGQLTTSDFDSKAGSLTETTPTFCSAVVSESRDATSSARVSVLGKRAQPRLSWELKKAKPRPGPCLQIHSPTN